MHTQGVITLDKYPLFNVPKPCRALNFKLISSFVRLPSLPSEAHTTGLSIQLVLSCRLKLRKPVACMRSWTSTGSGSHSVRSFIDLGLMLIAPRSGSLHKTQETSQHATQTCMIMCVCVCSVHPLSYKVAMQHYLPVQFSFCCCAGNSGAEAMQCKEPQLERPHIIARNKQLEQHAEMVMLLQCFSTWVAGLSFPLFEAKIFSAS